jgi:hypothetical protein
MIPPLGEGGTQRQDRSYCVTLCFKFQGGLLCTTHVIISNIVIDPPKDAKILYPFI